MRSIPNDLRDAFRTFRQRPGFSLLAVLTLAVGMSVNTVAFSVVNGLLFKVPGYANVERLGWIFINAPRNPYGEASLEQYEAFRTNATSIDAVVAEGRLPLRLTDGGGVGQVWSLAVSGNYFDVLGVHPEKGRLLSEADGQRPLAVVSHQFWSARLAEASPGRATVVLNDVQFTVVGVAPEGFHAVGGLYTPDIWVSLETSKLLRLPESFRSPDNPWLTLAGRKRAGATSAEAAAELNALVVRDQRETSGPGERRARFAPMKDGHPEGRAIGRIAALGMAVVGLVLLIACFNVAGLLITRATERRREMAVRTALGASRWRLIRQLVTEALVFAVLAGILALVMSAASGRLLATFSIPAPIPQHLDLSPDARTVLFTLCMILVATVLPVVFPARHAGRMDVRPMLADEAGSTTGGRRAGARRAFQVLQISGATMFLALAVLFVGSFRHMLTADLGFDTQHVLVVAAEPDVNGRSPAQAEQFFRSLTERLRSDPRIRGAASTTGIPYSLSSRATKLGTGGEDCRVAKCEPAQMFVVDPGYLNVMAIGLLQGRDLVDGDRRPGGGILVSRTAAERFWPDKNPLGEYVTFGQDGERAQIVGIVSDVGASGIGKKPGPHVYRAIRTEDYKANVTMVVGAKGDPVALAEHVRQVAASVDASMPLQSMHAMQEHLALPLWQGRIAAWLFGICSFVALALATVGLFGVISYTVAQRQREFGIRMSLGAAPRTILALVLKEGALLTAIGSVIGLLIGAACAAAVRAALVGVSVGSPGPYLVVGGVQAVITLVACAYPACKASRLDPITVIRERA